MGIDLAAFEFLLKANAEFGGFGSTIILGRQRLLMRTDADRDRFGSVLNLYRPDLSLNDIEDEDADRLIEALGGSPHQVMDNSEYEGAEVIHDLNEPLPAEYKGKFDTVIDIGTLEHDFNIGTAMKSMAEAVCVGGQFLCLNIANNHLGHGFWQFSPEVFFRTFCPSHGYEPHIAALYYHGKFHPLRDPQSVGQRLPIKTPEYTYITFGARKTQERPVFENGWPVQADYVAARTLFLARSAEREGDMTKAESILREALESTPHNPAYIAALAGVLRRTERHWSGEYRTLMTSATALAPELPSFVNEQRHAKAAGSTSARVDIGSIHVAIEDDRIPPNTRAAIERGRYEFKEREVARRMLCKGDRVIELGTGMGLVSMTIAQVVGANEIQSFEANPKIIELARENALANDLSITFRHAIPCPRIDAATTPHIDFYVLKSFEASSTRRVNSAQKAVQVPTTSLEDEIAAFGANTLVFDIEGFETEIVKKADLSGVDKIIFEIHPNIIGMNVCLEVIDQLEVQGLIMRKDLIFGDVLAFERNALPSSNGGRALFKTLAKMEEAAQASKWERALELANLVDDDISGNAYIQFRLAQIERNLGRDMLPRCEKALQLGSKDFLLYTDLVEQYLNRGQGKKASTILDALERIFPRSPHLPALRSRLRSVS